MSDKSVLDKLSDVRKWQNRQQQFLVDIMQSNKDSSENGVQYNEFADNDFTDEPCFDDEFDVLKSKFNVLPRIDECDDLSDESTDIEQIDDKEQQNSLFLNSESAVDLENCPVVCGIDGKKIKTFEELIEEKLRNNKEKHTEPPCLVKRPFLKKGEGLKKYKSLPMNNVRSQKAVKIRDAKFRGIAALSKPKVRKKVPETDLQLDPPAPTHRKVQRICNQNNKQTAQPKSAVQKKKLDILPTFGRIEKHCDKNIPPTNYVTKEWFDDESDSSPDSAFYRNYLENFNLPKHGLSSKSDAYISGDISNLERLLESIQMKKDTLKKNIRKVNLTSSSSDDSDSDKERITRRRRKSKKKPLSCSDQTKSDLSQPAENHHALKLKEEIANLEHKLSSLQNKCSENEREMSEKQKHQRGDDGEITSKLFGEVTMLRDQVGSLINRINTMELKGAQKTGENTQKSKSKVSKPKQPCVVKHSKDVSASGQKLDIQSDSNSTTVTYENGDKMTVCNDNISIYKYASNGATQTTFPDGLRVIEFPNGQIERIYKNGIKHIYYPNQFQRIINPNGSEEIITEDGTTIRISSEGNEIVDLPNGEREIRTKDFKKREYTDGTIKLVYNDGTQETRYPSGRLKIKDADGNVVVDSIIPSANIS